MKTVRISEEVWKEIADRGKFGETVDDVLRRVFELNNFSKKARTISRSRIQHATNRMSTYISGNRLIVEFASGDRNEWLLPNKADKAKLRKLRQEAAIFARHNNATQGQVNAVFKALTEDGYHVSK